VPACTARSVTARARARVLVPCRTAAASSVASMVLRGCRWRQAWASIVAPMPLPREQKLVSDFCRAEP